MIIVNFFGAPNAGKTTVAAELFSKLKKLNIEAEYVPELVKFAHYTNNTALLNDELYLFAEKNHRLNGIKIGGIEVAVTDGPILNSLAYMPENYHDGFVELVCSVYDSYENINVYIPGIKEFSSIGRSQTPSEAKRKGRDIKDMLDASDIEYLNIESGLDPEYVNEMIYDHVVKELYVRLKNPTGKLLEYIDSLQNNKVRKLAV